MVDALTLATIERDFLRRCLAAIDAPVTPPASVRLVPTNTRRLVAPTCPRGHVRTPETTYIGGDCRICAKAASRARRARLKQKEYAA
jgi:hypothetical protein